MKALTEKLNHFISDESGQDLIEYALIASLVGLVAVATLNTLSSAITGIFGRIGTALSGAGTTT